MRGSIFKRCGCKEYVSLAGGGRRRRSLGNKCSKLRRPDGSWNPRHGKWYFKVSTVDERTGKRKQLLRGGYATAADAQAELDKVKGRIRTGTVQLHGVTVGAWLTEWIESKTDLRANTLHSYQSHINRYLIPHLGKLKIEDLRATHVAAVMKTVTGGPTSAQRVRATLRSALADAVRHGLITVNAAALVKLPSGKSPRPLVWTENRVAHWRATGVMPSRIMCWTPAQLGAFLDAANADPLYSLWHLLAFRGLRRGEACGLEWSEVDLDAGEVAIVRQRIEVGGRPEEGAPKSEAGNRVISLDERTVAVLRAHRTAQVERRLSSVWDTRGDQKVFCQANGAPLSPSAVSKRFRALVAQQDLPPIRLHDLRHGAASLLLAAGVPMKIVQETLGHSSVVLTANTYTSVYPEVAREAAEAAAALVPRGQASQALG